jgi:SAM-dependent methyltransferase
MTSPQAPRLSKEQYPQFWGHDSHAFESNGDYQWMSKQIGEGSVLEIGCGIGLATNLLARRGALMAIDHNHHCLNETEEFLAGAGVVTQRLPQLGGSAKQGAVSLLEADVLELSSSERQVVLDFNPKWVVCWLVGSYSDAVEKRSPGTPRHEAVALYRQRLENAIAQLANTLPSVQGIHYVFRVQMPWNKVPEGQTEIARMFNDYVFPGTSFTTSQSLVAFRKWNIRDQSAGIVYVTTDAIEGAIPCLVSVLGTRSQ